ncbi:MAG TPA: hypothetical protein VHB21_15895, partial [Minicystis sp.]|nr:hypothetical protein [Minicystis sp.]
MRTPLVAAALAAASLLAAGARAEEPAMGRAQAAIARGDYTLAEKELASVKAGPDRAAALLAEARVELTTGRYDAAI